MATEYGKVENPTRSVEDFTYGDSAYWLIYDTIPSYGIITKIKSQSIKLTHFEDGYPFTISISPSYGGIRKASAKEAIRHFETISQKFDKEIAQGELQGALAARKQHYLQGVISKMDKTSSRNFYAATIPPQEPKTGIYVLEGVYAGNGPGTDLESIHIEPRISEKLVSQLMIELYPQGLGKIPAEVRNTPATSHGDLVAYWAYEVPEKALSLITNPHHLTINR